MRIESLYFTTLITFKPDNHGVLNDDKEFYILCKDHLTFSCGVTFPAARARVAAKSTWYMTAGRAAYIFVVLRGEGWL